MYVWVIQVGLLQNCRYILSVTHIRLMLWQNRLSSCLSQLSSSHGQTTSPKIFLSPVPKCLLEHERSF